MNRPDVWARLRDNCEKEAKQRSSPNLPQVASFARWHHQRVDESSIDVLRHLPSKYRLTDGDILADSSVLGDQDKGDPEPRRDLRDLVPGWLNSLPRSSDAEQESLYRKLLSVPVGESFREEILKLVRSYHPVEQTSKVLSDTLRCRYSTSIDIAWLYEEATSVNRARPSTNTPDPTAEAIQAICRLRDPSLPDLARFWIHQPRWPRPISQAWHAGAAEASAETSVSNPVELALCEAVMMTDPQAPPVGIQRAFESLAVIGNRPSIAMLEAMKSEIDAKPQAGLQRFINFALTKIRRRLAKWNDRE